MYHPKNITDFQFLILYVVKKKFLLVCWMHFKQIMNYFSASVRWSNSFFPLIY